MKKIVLIAAMATNYVIGKDNDMLWHISNDLKRFKSLTKGHSVTMGFNTYDSLPFKPLPGRKNIVISRTVDAIDGCVVVGSIKEAIDHMDDGKENFIIGGGEIYKQFLPFADKVYLTIIHKNFDGDVLFPILPSFDWNLTEAKTITDDDQNEFTYSYYTYERVNKLQYEIIQQAKDLATKFVNKVESGKARSKETYAECKALLAQIERLK